MLRRLEKRILVDLPTHEARKAMFKHHLPPVVVTGKSNGLELMADIDYERLAQVSICIFGKDSKKNYIATTFVANNAICLIPALPLLLYVQ